MAGTGAGRRHRPIARRPRAQGGARSVSARGRRCGLAKVALQCPAERSARSGSVRSHELG